MITAQYSVAPRDDQVLDVNLSMTVQEWRDVRARLHDPDRSMDAANQLAAVIRSVLDEMESRTCGTLWNTPWRGGEKDDA